MYNLFNKSNRGKEIEIRKINIYRKKMTKLKVALEEHFSLIRNYYLNRGPKV